MKERLLMSIVLMIHGFVTENISANIKKEIVEFSYRLEKLAEKTPNKVDDIAVKLLKVIFGID